MFGVPGQGKVRVSSGLHIATGSQDVQRCEVAKRRVDVRRGLSSSAILGGSDSTFWMPCGAIATWCFVWLRSSSYSSTDWSSFLNLFALLLLYLRCFACDVTGPFCHRLLRLELSPLTVIVSMHICAINLSFMSFSLYSKQFARRDACTFSIYVSSKFEQCFLINRCAKHSCIQQPTRANTHTHARQVSISGVRPVMKESPREYILQVGRAENKQVVRRNHFEIQCKCYICWRCCDIVTVSSSCRCRRQQLREGQWRMQPTVRQYARKFPVSLSSGIPATHGQPHMREAKEQALRASKRPRANSSSTAQVNRTCA